MNAPAAPPPGDIPGQDEGDIAREHGVRRFARDNGISLVFGFAFLLALAGQAVAGCAEFNNQLATEGLAQVGLLEASSTI
jgi:hypothetical protein